MSKRLIYVAFWRDSLAELVAFLKEQKYSETETAAIEMVLNKVDYDESL